jgi:hypothetical protein
MSIEEARGLRSYKTFPTQLEVAAMNINWKWFLIGAAAGYLGAAYVPKLLNK